MAKTKQLKAPIPNAVTKATALWQKRIVGYDEMPVAALYAKLHPQNWHTHTDKQAEVMLAILNKIGIVQNVLLNKRTGNLIDGELRIRIAHDHNQATLPVTLVDLSEREEKTILGLLDKIKELAGTDPSRMDSLLADIGTLDDSVLDSFLDEMRATNDVLADIEEQLSQYTGGAETTKADGPTRDTVKVVVAVKDLAVFERALRTTGAPVRGEALMELAKAYLQQHDPAFALGL